jgi:hypothetical protein
VDYRLKENLFWTIQWAVWNSINFVTVCKPAVGNIICICNKFKGSRDSSVGIATGYGLDNQGGGGSSSPDRVKIVTSPYRPDRLWGPPNLL